ncbi:hypothetical protein IGI04_007215 [Brassica rapa subsp. trilocularis]|uniref:Aspartic peptidase DDI1-type domain-containing protein n=1 Tax=Brassica rapa subsp. trilocularis TaxID=1813537 RepID=A0ABQ7NJ28_BRACM|nr:hypothetical protein IGI04_007215 [Brassica rapa subsp. trilocularis]
MEYLHFMLSWLKGIRSDQSASREEAAEKRKPRRSMQHSARRSMEIPDQRRSPSIDNNTSSSIDTRQPQSTETPSSSADTRPPPSTEEILLSTDIFHPTSIDASSQTSIDTEPRDMVVNIILLRDENGDLHDHEGHLCNAESQKVDAKGAVIPEPSTATEDAKVLQPRTMAELIRPSQIYTNRSAVQPPIDSIHEVSLVEQAICQDEDQRNIEEMKFMLEKLLKEQQEMTEDLNLHLDSLYKEVNGRLETLDTHSKFLCLWEARTGVDRHQHLNIARHHRLSSHSDFAARHPHPPTLVRIRPNDVDRQQAERIDRQHHERIDRQEHGSIDRKEQQRIDRFPYTPYRVRLPNLDAHRLNATQNSSQTSVCLGTTEQISQQTEDATEKEHSTLAETSLVEIDQLQRDGYEHRVKSRKPFIPKHLRREVNKVELDGFHKRVKRVPKDMSFEDAYYKYRLGNFFRESRETYEDTEQLFNKVCRKPKRTLQKEQDPGKFLIPCFIQNHDLPNALCDTGSAVSIMSIDTADLLGLKMEPSQDSFIFVDNSNANSAGMIGNIKVDIGDCTIPVDFHVLEIKSGKPSSLLFGRAFMATVGAVCDQKKNMMCLTNIDEGVYYDPVDKTRSKDFISCIELSDDEAHTADSTREPAKSKSASIDNQPSASVDKQPSESIDPKLPASVDTLHISEQTVTEKSKSGGRTRQRKKKKRKKNIDADFLSLVPSQFQEGSLECRVRCRGGHEPFTKLIGKYLKQISLHKNRRVLHQHRPTLNCVDQYSNQWHIFRIGTRVDDCLEYRPIRACSGTFNMVILESFGAFRGAELHRRVRCLAMDGDLPTIFELAFQCHRSQVNQHLLAEVMPVLLKSGQSASREEASEKRKPRRSMQHSARRSMEIPDRGPCIFYDFVKPRSHHKLPECPWTTRNPIYDESEQDLVAKTIKA